MSLITPNDGSWNIGASAFKFEKLKIHDKLIIIREVNSQYTVGYVHHHPDHSAWIWFIKDKVTEILFDSEDEATEHLCQMFIAAKMNKAMEKLNIKGDPRFDKR